MTSWHSYPKIYNLGHAYITDLLLDEVIVEEKVDGSQFSFGIFDGVIQCRSKGQQLVVDAPEKMFERAVENVKALASYLHDGWTYRGEYLQKPKHNALAYDRIPNRNIIIFDISPSEEKYLSYEEKLQEAQRLGLEVVPILYQGKIETFELFKSLLDNVSVLGGQKIEGVVIKNYKRFGQDKKVLLGKHVSEAFKEVHGREWAKENPTSGDFISVLAAQYKTPARWSKAIQHLKEAGKLTGTPTDIGLLCREVPTDIQVECEAEIKQKLFDHFWGQIKRISIRGLPEWYKDELAKVQFEKAPAQFDNKVDEEVKTG